MPLNIASATELDTSKMDKIVKLFLHTVCHKNHLIPDVQWKP